MDDGSVRIAAVKNLYRDEESGNVMTVLWPFTRVQSVFKEPYNSRRLNVFIVQFASDFAGDDNAIILSVAQIQGKFFSVHQEFDLPPNPMSTESFGRGRRQRWIVTLLRHCIID